MLGIVDNGLTLHLYAWQCAQMQGNGCTHYPLTQDCMNLRVLHGNMLTNKAHLSVVTTVNGTALVNVVEFQISS